MFRNIVIAVREPACATGERYTECELRNIDWADKVIFVPDSKTPEGRRFVPMSDCVENILR